MKRGRLVSLALLVLVTTAPPRATADINHEIDTANWIALPITAVDGFFPTPWACPGLAPSPQLMVQFHENWHCSNPDHVGSNWGNRFFGFHKQFLLGYDRYLASIGEPYLQTWVAAPGALIPPAHGGRPNNSPCTTCLALPSQFKLPAAGGTLDTFASLTAIGDAVVGWHNTNHGRIANAGGSGSCTGSSPDMNCPRWSTRDPIFYRYHHIFDDVQNAWRTHQATDIAIVFDRSGSMSLPTTGGGTRLDAAKAAASLFADLLEDGSSHKLGLVSFSTNASSPADMPLTPVAGGPAAIATALGGIAAAGSTSIGDGLEKAQALVAAGSEPRKGILLLTDGMENTAPTIATAQALLQDTHVCSVGLGTPGSLDGPKLRDLSEHQGGIYISTPSALELKKFFVFCFADIFDTFVGEDPISMLPAAELVSKPTVHTAYLDEKIAFVLSWTNPAPTGALQLVVTSPSGAIVNLSAPGVESVFGPTWHIVRMKTPYRGERDGFWTARAARPIRGFVNGFSSNAFADAAQGAALVRTELAHLCPKGCRNVLYFEDEMMHDTFEDHNSIYADALYNEAGRQTLGRITRPRDAAEFTQALRERGFDLLVYSSQFTEKDQPYDSLLSEILCSNEAPRRIVSDNRNTAGARAILRCAGALRGDGRNFAALVPAPSLLTEQAKLRAPRHVDVFSYELTPTSPGAVQAKSDTGVATVVAQGQGGRDESFFITVLTRASAKVKPFTYRSNYYTLESLHPTFYIPEMYWPVGGFDKITASVEVTRPLRSLGQLLASTGAKEGATVGGDTLTPRQATLMRLEKKGEVVPTESKRFDLYDDGTHGDSTANNHYWEAALPSEFTASDGDYRFHANFRLCRADFCIDREAEQTVTVRTRMDANTKVAVQRQPASRGRSVTRVIVTPVDKAGTPLGPGLVEEIVLRTGGDVRVERRADLDGRGAYEFLVSWTSKDTKPTLSLEQFGRPGNAIPVRLE